MSGSSLEHRHVLITGAGSGIGRALAEMAMTAGARATLVDVSSESLHALSPVGECVLRAMDVSDPDGWARLQAPESGWDFVALNAGIMTSPPEAPARESALLTMDLRRYERVFRVNVDGVVHGVRRVVPHLADGGAIVATASAAGLVGFGQDVAYSMSKHAVVGLVRGLAQILARRQRGQRACAICPGGVRTGIVPSAFQGVPMMEPSVIAREIVALWLEGRNGDVKAKMRAELPALSIPEPELPAWW